MPPRRRRLGAASRGGKNAKSEPFVRVRQQNTEVAQLPFLEGQAEMLPLEDWTFNRVLASNRALFVRDAERSVTEMARVLKPAGGSLSANWDAGVYGPRTVAFVAGWLIEPGELRCFGQLRNFAISPRLQGCRRVEQNSWGRAYPPYGIAARLLTPLICGSASK